MPSFNFQPNFAPLIRSGVKKQTIRQTRRCKPGDTMHLFIGLRTKTCVKIAQRPCIVTDYCHIAPDGLTLGDVRKHPRDIDEFARLDGFSSFEEMLRWFSDRYGHEGFVGTVHRWAGVPESGDGYA